MPVSKDGAATYFETRSSRSAPQHEADEARNQIAAMTSSC
jgi:hypothetical protein